MNEHPRAESYGRATPVTRRRLLAGAGAVLAAGAVSGGLTACGADGQVTPKSRGGRTPLRTPPPTAVPERPRIRSLGPLKAGPADKIYPFRFSPDGTTLAGVDSDKGILLLWDAASGVQKAMVRGAGFTDLVFSPDGRTLVTGSDARAQFWDAATLRSLGRQIAAPANDGSQHFSAIAVSPDGKLLAACGSGKGPIHFHDAATGKPVGTPLPEVRARFLVFSPDGRTLASLGKSGDLRIWDVAARKLRSKPPLPYMGDTDVPVFSPDGASVAIGGVLPYAYLYSAATGKRQGKPVGEHNGGTNGVAYSTDGRTLITADYDGLHFWDAATHKKRASVSLPGSPPTEKELQPGVIDVRPGGRSITRLALSPDGRTVAVASGKDVVKNKVSLWRLE